jgi:hypothetical protein
MLDVAVILPCKGRHEQTIRNAARLKSQAEYQAAWIAAIGPDDARLSHVMEWAPYISETPMTYWQALTEVTNRTQAPLLCAVANDCVPSPHWLRRGIEAYAARFGDAPGLMGFNGDGHGPEHSCHMLIHRDLLAKFGGWPVWYHHNFGDTELCLRAQQAGRYGKAAWAVLFHDHWRFGAEHDAVYKEGDVTFDKDRALFLQRRKEGGW